MWARIRAWLTDGHDEMVKRLCVGPWARDYVLECARQCLGMGEKGGNNRGPDIDRFRRGRKLKPGQGGAWCASFCSFILEESWAHFYGFPCWSWLDKKRQARMPVKRTANAKKLANRIAKAGCFVFEPSPGDFVLWKRKGGHHIGIVSKVRPGEFYSIEGNKGRYDRKTGHGSKVREYRHELGEPNILFFARLP